MRFTELFTVTERDSPVILHAPHGGRIIPERFRESYVVDAAELEAELDRMTDHFTDELVRSVGGASSVINHLSRLVVDVERFPDESEEMNQVGMGVLYTHGSQRQEIRRPSESERTELMGCLLAAVHRTGRRDARSPWACGHPGFALIPAASAAV